MPFEPITAAKTISDCFNPPADKKKDVGSIEGLYWQGVELVEKVVRRIPLGVDPITPVVMALAAKVTSKSFQNDEEIHRTLSKTYRLFIELMWHQRLEMPNGGTISEETKKELSDHAREAAKRFKQDHEIEFEYECAREAAKILESSHSIWENFKKLSCDVVDQVTLEHLPSKILTLKRFWMLHTVEAWYFDSYSVRWPALCVRTERDFLQITTLKNYLNTCTGGRDAINLACVYQDFLQNPKVTDLALVNRAVDHLKRIKSWTLFSAKASGIAESCLRIHSHAISVKLKMTLPDSSPNNARGDDPLIRKLLQSLFGPIEDPEQRCAALIELLPKFTEEHYDRLLDGRLPRLVNATQATQHIKIAIALADWHAPNIAMQTNVLDTIRACQKPIAYLAQAQAIARAHGEFPEETGLYCSSSRLFLGVILKHHIKNITLQKDFAAALQHRQRETEVQEVEEILALVKGFKAFCSTQNDWERLGEVYLQFSEVPGNARYAGRIRTELNESPFPQDPITKTYQDAFQPFRDAFKISDLSLQQLQSLAITHLINGLNILFESALTLMRRSPPCPYVIELVGSTARGEVSPDSSLDLRVFIKNEDAKAYFELLLTTLDLQIHALGGSSAPIFPGISSGLRLGSAEIIPSSLVAQRQGSTLDDDTLAKSLLPSKTLRELEPEELTTSYPTPLASQKEALLLFNLKALSDQYVDNCGKPLDAPFNLKGGYLIPIVHLLSDLKSYWNLIATHTLDIIEEMKGQLHPHSQIVMTQAITTLYKLRFTLHREKREPDEIERKELDRINQLVLKPLYTEIKKILDTAPQAFLNAFSQSFSSCNLLEIALRNDIKALKSGSILHSQIESLIVRIASLPLDNHNPYYELLSKHDFPLDHLRGVYLDHLPERVVQKLASIPTPQGVRQSTIREAAHLQNTLKSLTTENNAWSPVQIITSSNPEETLYLDPLHIKSLLDPSGNIKKGHDLKSKPTHNVSRLTSASNDLPPPFNKLHFKQKPTHPMMEYAIHSLTSRIAGSFTPATELVRFNVFDKDGTFKKTYPVLISQTVPGETLEALTEPIPWKDLSLDAQKHWTWAFLCTILTKPGDGKPENYILASDEETVSPWKTVIPKKAVYCIDNDISLFKPLVAGVLTNTVNFSSMLFFAVKDAILDKEVLKDFAKLDTRFILQGWIKDLFEKEAAYKKLFNDSVERNTLYTEDKDIRFKPTLVIRKDILSALVAQFSCLKQFVAQDPSAHLTLSPLWLLESLVDLRDTGATGRVGIKVSKRYADAVASEPFSDRLETAVTEYSAKSIRSCRADKKYLGEDPPFPEIEEGKYSLKEAQKVLCDYLIGKYHTFTFKEEERCLEGDFSLISDDEQAAEGLEVFSDFALFSGTQLTTIIIKGCKALRSGTLERVLHSKLKVLDIRDSPHIAGSDIEMIKRTCPDLTDLNISGCPMAFVASDRGFRVYLPLVFPQLKTLIMNNCPKLTTLQVNAPLLESLFARNNPVLKTPKLPTVPPRADFKECPQANLRDIYPLILQAATNFHKTDSHPDVIKALEDLADDLESQGDPEQALVLRNRATLSALRQKKGKIDPPMVFGECEWNYFFGDVGEEPPLPGDIAQIMNGPCPIWNRGRDSAGKKVYETHLLTLIPKTVNGNPFTLDYLGELIRHPRGGGKATQYRYYWEDVQKEHGNTRVEKSYWVLMTRDVLEGTREETFADQQAIVAQYPGYEVPRALEAATAILMEHVKTGNRLYPDDPWTWTRCQEKTNARPVVVGGFAPGGLHVYPDWGDYDNNGLAALRKF